MASSRSGRSRRWVKLVALALPLCLAVAACGGGNEKSSSSGSGGNVGKITILLPFSRSIAFWPVHIAEEQGYFKAAGLDVTSEATDGSSFVVQQVAAGKSPVGIAVAEPVLLGYEQNGNFQSVYEFLTRNVFDMWVLTDSPIQKVADIPKGSSITLVEPSGGEVPRMNAALDKAGLEPGKDVNFKYFGRNPAVAANLLDTGGAAALEISWNELVGVQQALKEQGKQLRCITCANSDALASESLIVSKKFMTDHKDVVEKLGRAIAQGTVFGQTNPDAALAIMKKVNPEEQEGDADYAKNYFKAALDMMQPRQPKNQYGWQDPAAYQRSMDLMLTPGIPAGLSGKVDLNALIDNDLVDAYNNFDHDAVVQAAKQAPA